MPTPPLDLRGRKILVTGGHGFLGKHLLAVLRARGVRPEDVAAPSRGERDLLREEDCLAACEGREIVFHLAVRLGGIAFNLREPGRIFRENVLMNTHMLEAARRAGVRRFVAVGSVCAYPKETPLPTREEDLYAGKPEESNLAYGLSKRMLHAQIEAYRIQYGFGGIYLLPANLYGPGDDFDPVDSHVIPAMIRRFLEAAARGDETVVLWGDGLSTREFLYAPDCAEALVRAAERYDEAAPLNLGGHGGDIAVRDLARLVADRTGFSGQVAWDTTKPSGQRRRLFDSSRSIALLGAYATTSLEAGLTATIRWYRETAGGSEEGPR